MSDVTIAATAAHPGHCYVRTGLTGDLAERVALYEWHPWHPDGGEVWVAKGCPPIKVARTPRVALYLQEGRLVEVPEVDALAAIAAWDAAMFEREKRTLSREAQEFALRFPLLAAKLAESGVLADEAPTRKRKTKDEEEIAA